MIAILISMRFQDCLSHQFWARVPTNQAWRVENYTLYAEKWTTVKQGGSVSAPGARQANLLDDSPPVTPPPPQISWSR